MKLLKILVALLLIALLGQLCSCTAAQPWRGFSGPAYLPARPVHPAQPAAPARPKTATLTPQRP